MKYIRPDDRLYFFHCSKLSSLLRSSISGLPEQCIWHSPNVRMEILQGQGRQYNLKQLSTVVQINFCPLHDGKIPIWSSSTRWMTGSQVYGTGEWTVAVTRSVLVTDNYKWMWEQYLFLQLKILHGWITFLELFQSCGIVFDWVIKH